MFSIFKNMGHVLYRIWFYILATMPIVIFFPLLLLATVSRRTYPYFFWLARNIWASSILYGMGCFPKIFWEEKMKKGNSYMLIANHTSMLDIMLMLKVSKNPFVFVGKKELEKIPVFGFFYKRACIVVDRDDPKSRAAVYRRAEKRLGQGLSICIFPEGGVPEASMALDRFKDGAFRLAIAHKIPIVPMVFYDNKKRFSWTFFSGGPGKLRVKVTKFVETRSLKIEDTSAIRKEIYERLLNELLENA